ncbi:uncharacterized protein [Parasteatoda tepidariorum]|uniref:uncharacterized protein n=1 Tax=Parasteatoda tepidariorum TaxID=114398 RepID=UPI0039BC93CF
MNSFKRHSNRYAMINRRRGQVENEAEIEEDSPQRNNAALMEEIKRIKEDHEKEVRELLDKISAYERILQTKRSSLKCHASTQTDENEEAATSGSLTEISSSPNTTERNSDCDVVLDDVLDDVVLDDPEEPCESRSQISSSPNTTERNMDCDVVLDDVVLDDPEEPRESRSQISSSPNTTERNSDCDVVLDDVVLDDPEEPCESGSQISSSPNTTERNMDCDVVLDDVVLDDPEEPRESRSQS